MLKKLAVLGIGALGVGLSLTNTAAAQQHNNPALNAFGRFWGFGWSDGYHAGAYDGRFQHVKDSHPASMYGSNALLYPYQAGYEPQRPYIHASQGYAQPAYTEMGNSQAFGSILQGAPNQAQQGLVNQIGPTPVPAIPPKPTEPPPTWLRPYLKDEAKADAELPKPKTREDAEIEETSPSDLLKPKADSAKPTKEEPAKASDDDDLLTLTPPKSAFERYSEARRKQNSNR